MSAEPSETLAEFARSFSYGERSDLSFKFLSKLDPGSAGELIRRILEESGALLDTGDPTDLIDLVVDAQAAAYGAGDLADRYRYDEGPFVSPARPVARSSVALVTSSGHFVAGEDPEPFGVPAMTQEEAKRRIGDFLKAEPILSAIPVDTPPGSTRVRHGGYDVRGSLADRNSSFPIDRLRELEADGLVGRLCPEAYSFVGAAAQGRIIRSCGPAWADLLTEQGAEIAVLVPI